ncbi:PREDICTED: VWFA and cache domain-containing protein 1-like isoform X1 [Acropora digitifera]|uniref:VWFA and cache domain-containing protein 1-like isoform X1 n=1 Tax=Acropora digitifera TaxID=70779 RepID=UPI00077AEAAA|nr:PREDICTED: VWFA and cache domain-containing protein 1-like isoform X1 [Acropora digitifera]
MASLIVASKNISLTLLGIVFYSVVFLQVNASQLDPSLISLELRFFANDALGVDKLQEQFNELLYDERTIDGATLTKELAVKMSDKFKRRFNVARRLRNVVEAHYSIAAIPRTAKQCCKVDKSTLIYKERFRSKVDLGNICLLISGKAPSNPIHLDSDAILKEAKSILHDDPVIKWQYFASQEGVYTSFPAYDDTNPCGRYDPRVRPFYLETATPEAKDVVLMIDTSHSMIGDKMETAQEAARTVLSITNPRDQIGVVSFNDEASAYSGNDVNPCYSQRLALAVPINKKALSKYVGKLIGTGKCL